MIGIWIFIGIIIILTGVISIRTIQFTKKKQIVLTAVVQKDKVSKEEVLAMANKLAKAIQIKTISYMDTEKIDYNAFLEFHQVLKKNFPGVHNNLELTLINKYSMLFHWKGKNPVRKPSLYMAHMDVVPIDDESLDSWEHPPFDGYIDGNYIWGRGALDTKVTMISLLEGAERLIRKGFTPQNDVYFAFGHDEEIQSTEGAIEIVKYLKTKDIELEFIIDEGGIITEGSVPGVSEPVALIGIGEKGSADVTVSIQSEGGHASTPPQSTALGKIASLIYFMEKNQFKKSLISPVHSFLMNVGPYMGLFNRIILGNLWLFKPVFLKVFSKSSNGNALLRTTTAATMASASKASNVLPQKASTTFNFRVALNENIDNIIQHIRTNAKKAGIDPATLLIDIIQSKNPSKISKANTESFNRMDHTIQKVFGQTIVTPYVLLAATDSYKYEDICDQIYRFAPLKVTNSELSRIHNVNERISLDNIRDCVAFYESMLQED